MSSRMILRQKLYSIGDVDTQIYGNKLLSKLQALKLFFYQTRVLKLDAREAAIATINEVKIFWQKAQLPTQRNDHCVQKLLKLYGQYRNLQKSMKKQSNKQKEDDFVLLLKKLFDISHNYVVKIVDKDKLIFLCNQRKDGRVGYIANIESEYDEMERKKLEEEIYRQQLIKNEQEKQRSVELILSGESLETNRLSQKSISFHSNYDFEEDAGPSEPKKARGKVNIWNSDLVLSLDRCKISDQNAVYLIVGIAAALNVELDSFILNRSSIRRYREKIRKEKMEKLKQTFKDVDLTATVLHWDGKIIKNVMSDKMTEIVQVVISCGNVEKLLGVPELDNGQGITQANVIFEVISDWRLVSSIKAVCCDTTSSNLGHLSGATTLLEQSLEKNLLYLPCRHYILELILRAVFDLKNISSTTGPNIPLFKTIQSKWLDINQNQYNTGIEDEYVYNVIHDKMEDINSFVQNQLEITQPRDDYKEFLLLVQIFIGKIPSSAKFRKPGAMHHARWMSKAIYFLKMYLFRKQLNMTSKLQKSLSQVCIFIILVYIQAWLTCTLVTAAPNHDLQFIKKLCDYKSKDVEISEIALHKFRNHLWYLNAESAAMAFFDEKLSDEIKRKMVIKLNSIDDKDFPKRIHIKNINNLYDLDIDFFISSQSYEFFKRFEINSDFLMTNPSDWNSNDNYNNKGLALVKNLKVVNDIAERTVKLMEEYSNILTKNEDQKQFIIQLTSELKKKIPDARKSTVVNSYKKN